MFKEPNDVPQAILTISKSTLDFGTYDPADPIEGKGSSILTITNTGERILVGRITLQVGWISVDPPNFRLAPGESSRHVFTIIMTMIPEFTSSRKMGSDFIALINSNGGSETLAGFYYCGPDTRQKKENPIKPWFFGAVFASLALTAGIIYLAAQSAQKAQKKDVADYYSNLYTQAAETFLAEIEQQTPSLIPGENGSGVQLNELGTAVPGSLFITQIAAPTMTFTPWPRSQFVSPDQFVIAYYTAINSKDYQTAWWMLSEHMQQVCCYAGGNVPYDNFTAGWSNVSGVEIKYAYLQAYDVNPAEVTTDVVYHHVDGTKDDEEFYTVLIISDSVRNTLLIDEIK